MRILHVDSGPSMRGGQWQAVRLAQGLRGAGHTVRFLARWPSPCFEAARAAGLDPKPLTAVTLRAWSRQVDLTHAHDARSHTFAVALSGAPVIVSRRVAFPIRGALSRWKYARPRHFIAVSHHVKRELLAAGVGPEKISVVYDGVPLLAPSMPSRRVIAPESSDPAKGSDLAAEAARLAGLPLHFSTNLEADLADAGLFVYITRDEGLGSAALLAMSACVPVIASNVGGLPEIVTQGETGLLVSNKAGEIAAAIRQLQQDQDLARRLAAGGRKLVEERFTLAAMVASTARVYEDVLGEAR